MKFGVVTILLFRVFFGTLSRSAIRFRILLFNNNNKFIIVFYGLNVFNPQAKSQVECESFARLPYYACPG